MPDRLRICPLTARFAYDLIPRFLPRNACSGRFLPETARGAPPNLSFSSPESLFSPFGTTPIYIKSPSAFSGALLRIVTSIWISEIFVLYLPTMVIERHITMTGRGCGFIGNPVVRTYVFTTAATTTIATTTTTPVGVR